MAHGAAGTGANQRADPEAAEDADGDDDADRVDVPGVNGGASCVVEGVRAADTDTDIRLNCSSGGVKGATAEGPFETCSNPGGGAAETVERALAVGDATGAAVTVVIVVTGAGGTDATDENVWPSSKRTSRDPNLAASPPPVVVTLGAPTSLVRCCPSAMEV